MSEIIPGSMIGRYEVVEVLGQGGMATVYRAIDTRLDREVAVKLIRTEMFPPAILKEVLARFEREAKALARLDHPNILRVFDFGEHEGVPYLVMAFVGGGSLRERIQKSVQSKKRIPMREAAALLAPVARALHYAHSRQIVHRDVKPANILLNDRDEPLLSDFGIAKILDAGAAGLTGTGLAIGTPEYMAPEQSAGDDVDARVDIYALGVVFFEMISGRRPFEGSTPIDVLIKIRTAPLPSIRAFLPEASPDVETILSRALARETASRYASMTLFAADLDTLASGAAGQPGAALPFTPAGEGLTTPQPFIPPHPAPPPTGPTAFPAADSGKTMQTPPAWRADPGARQYPDARPFDTMPMADSGQTMATPQPRTPAPFTPPPFKTPTPPPFTPTPPPFTPTPPPAAADRQAPGGISAAKAQPRPAWMFFAAAFVGLILLVMTLLFGAALIPPAPTPTYLPTSAAAAALPSAAPTAVPTEAKEPVTLLVYIPAYSGYDDVIQDLVNHFRTDNPHFNITVTAQPDQKFKNELVAGTAPDLVMTSSDTLSGVAPYLVDLQDYGYTQIEISASVDSPIADSSIFQGRVWSVPADAESAVLFFNRALANEGNFPADPQDMQGFLDRAAEFQSATGTPLLCFGIETYYTGPLLFAYGMPGFLDEQGNIFLKTAEGVNAFSSLREWRGLTVADPNYETCQTAFTDGKTAAFFTGKWATGNFDAAGIDYGMVPFGRPFVHGNAWVVTRAAAERGRAEAAVMLMRYLTSPESQVKIALATGRVPASRAAQAHPDVLALNGMPTLLAAIHNGVAIPPYRHGETQWWFVYSAIEETWKSQGDIEYILSTHQQEMEVEVKRLMDNAPTSLVAWVPGYLTTMEPVLREIGDRMEKRNPALHIDFEFKDDLVTDLHNATANNAAPDLVLYDSNGISTMRDDLIRLDWWGLTPDYLWSSFMPQSVDSVRVGDAFWGLPVYQSGVILLYNTNMVSAQDFPEDAMNFGQLIDLATKYRAANPDKVLLCIPPHGYFAANVFLGHDLPAFVDEGGTAYLDTSAAITAASFFASWREIAPPAKDLSECIDQFNNGQAAAIIAGKWLKDQTDLDGIPTGILPFGRTFLTTTSWMVTKTAGDQNRAGPALEAALYLSGPEAQQVVMQGTAQTPTHWWVVASDEAANMPDIVSYLKAYEFGVALLPNNYTFAAFGPTEILTQALFSGSQTIDEALATAQQQILDAIQGLEP